MSDPIPKVIPVPAVKPSRNFPPASVRIGLVLLAALLVRWFAAALTFTPNFDTGTPGLMGVHILRGESFPLFFYGQTYMGALEAYLAAALFALFGISDTVLALSPALFSVGWIGATYLLFRELFDQRTGLIAAIVMAFPEWHILWYSIGSYGGYPGSLFFGTLSLWLTVRLVKRGPSPPHPGLHIFGLGFFTGLALWTNYLSAPYILTAACVLVRGFATGKLPLGLVPKFAWGGIPFLIGFAPSLRVLLQGSGSTVSTFVLKRNHFILALQLLRDNAFPRLLAVHSKQAPSWTSRFLLLILALTAILAGVKLVLHIRRRTYSFIWVPFLFLGIFFLLYLPNYMAVAAGGGPRYLIPFWSMFIILLFGIALSMPNHWSGRAGRVLLTLWTCTHAALLVVTSHEKAEDTRKHRHAYSRILDAARASNTTDYYMLGDSIWGYRGQLLTFKAKNEIRFVSLYDERYHPAAEAIETASAYGYASRTHMDERVKGALSEMNVGYETSQASNTFLAYGFQVHPKKQRALTRNEVTLTATGDTEGNPAGLLDNCWDTRFKGKVFSSSLVVDFGETRPMDSMVLFSPERHQFGLPKSYLLEISHDGKTFTKARSSKRRIALSYTLGDRVYFKGYFGMQTISLDGLNSRYLRFTVTETQGNREFWSLHKILFMEHVGESRVFKAEDAVEATNWTAERGIDFVIADRRVSALLRQAAPSNPKSPDTYLRFNPKQKETTKSRLFQPRDGMALMVCESVAEDMRDLMIERCGEDVVVEMAAFADQVILHLQSTSIRETFFWNGFTAQYTKELNLLAGD